MREALSESMHPLKLKIIKYFYIYVCIIGCQSYQFLQNPCTPSHSSHLSLTQSSAPVYHSSAPVQYTSANHQVSRPGAQLTQPLATTQDALKSSLPVFDTQGKTNYSQQHSQNKFETHETLSTSDMSVDPRDLLIATSDHGDLMLGQGDLFIQTDDPSCVPPVNLRDDF